MHEKGWVIKHTQVNTFYLNNNEHKISKIVKTIFDIRQEGHARQRREIATTLENFGIHQTKKRRAPHPAPNSHVNYR